MHLYVGYDSDISKHKEEMRDIVHVCAHCLKSLNMGWINTLHKMYHPRLKINELPAELLLYLPLTQSSIQNCHKILLHLQRAINVLAKSSETLPLSENTK